MKDAVEVLLGCEETRRLKAEARAYLEAKALRLVEDGLSLTQVARALGRPRKTVGTWLRARVAQSPRCDRMPLGCP